MTVASSYLHDVGRLAEKLTREFGALPYEKFAEDASKTESAVMRLLIMKEGCTWLPRKIRQQLVSIDWHAVTGHWDRHAARHVGFDQRKLWETIVQKLPEMSAKIEEMLKGQDEAMRTAGPSF